MSHPGYFHQNIFRKSIVMVNSPNCGKIANLSPPCWFFKWIKSIELLGSIGLENLAFKHKMKKIFICAFECIHSFL